MEDYIYRHIVRGLGYKYDDYTFVVDTMEHSIVKYIDFQTLAKAFNLNSFKSKSFNNYIIGIEVANILLQYINDWEIKPPKYSFEYFLLLIRTIFNKSPAYNMLL